MHPRARARAVGRRDAAARAQAVLEFVRERGAVHPREVDAHFAHGTVTQLLGRLVERDDAPARRHALPRPAARGAARQRHPHLRGARARSRAGATPPRGARGSTRSSTSSSRKYAPLPASSLSMPGAPAALRACRSGAASSTSALAARQAAARARARRRRRLVLAGRRAIRASAPAPDDACACWRRSTRSSGTGARFELFWGWAYRFEAYTPAPKRKLGYYALPLLWRDQVIGWGNVAVERRPAAADVRLRRSRRPPRDRAFGATLDGGAGARCATFLGALRSAQSGARRGSLAARARCRAAARAWPAAARSSGRASRPRTREQDAGRDDEAAHQSAGAVGDPADEARADDLPGREHDRERADAGGPRGRRQVVAHQRGRRRDHRQEHAAEQHARQRTPRPDARSAPAAASRRASSAFSNASASPPRKRCSSRPTATTTRSREAQHA